MYWKIEPSGITDKINKNGDLCIQIRYCFFLEPGENGYEERYIEQKRIKESSIGKTELTNDDFESIGQYVNIPLHNHFIQLPYNVTNDFIENIGHQLLNTVLDYHNQRYFDYGELVCIPCTIPQYDKPTSELIEIAKARVVQIKNDKKWL